MNALIEALTRIAKNPAFAKKVLAGDEMGRGLVGELLQTAAQESRWMPHDVAAATVLKQGSSPRMLFEDPGTRGIFLTDPKTALQYSYGETPKLSRRFLDVRNPYMLSAANDKVTTKSLIDKAYDAVLSHPMSAPGTGEAVSLNSPDIMVHNLGSHNVYKPHVIPADPMVMADLFRSKLAKALMGG